MEPVAAQEVRKSPSPSPSEKPFAKRPFGLCPSRVVLPPSAAATEALLPLGGGSAPSIDASSLAANQNTLPLSTSQPVHRSIHNMNSENKLHTIPSILIVEDDPDIAMGLQDFLEFKGFQVNCAQTCRQAFSSIEQHAYHAILLDLGLPDGDGCSILEKLQVSNPSLPVIVLTASNRNLGSLRAYARLTKPWEREELCTILRHAVGIA